MFAALETAMPPLTTLTINPANELLSTTWKLQAECVASLTSLRHLSMTDLYDAEAVALLTAAAGLPDLLELMVDISSDWDGALEGLGRGFPALTHLKTNLPHRALGNLLSFIQSTHLQDANIGLWTMSNIAGALTSIERFTALKHFNLGWGVTPSFQWEDIVPLMNCPLLEELTLYGPDATFIFDDDRVRTAVQAWPRLRMFKVEEDYDTDPLHEGFPSITLQALTCFATHCPLLESLTIHIDAQNPPIAPTTQSPNVTHLCFHRSPIHERSVDAVATFITKMWPNVILMEKEIILDPYYFSLDAEQTWAFGSLWRQVWENVAEDLGQSLHWPVSSSAIFFLS